MGSSNPEVKDAVQLRIFYPSSTTHDGTTQQISLVNRYLADGLIFECYNLLLQRLIMVPLIAHLIAHYAMAYSKS